MDNNALYDLYVTAYTDAINIASEYVLKTNRFTKFDKQIMYEKELSNIWVRKIN